jgi:hypothetical protein
VSEHGLPVDLPTEREAEVWAVPNDDGTWSLMVALREDGRLSHHRGAASLTADEALEFLLWAQSTEEET